MLTPGGGNRRLVIFVAEARDRTTRGPVDLMFARRGTRHFGAHIYVVGTSAIVATFCIALPPAFGTALVPLPAARRTLDGQIALAPWASVWVFRQVAVLGAHGHMGALDGSLLSALASSAAVCADHWNASEVW